MDRNRFDNKSWIENHWDKSPTIMQGIAKKS